MANPFGIKPLTSYGSMYGSKSKKKVLGTSDKEILWERAGKRCESCGKRLEFPAMQAGHKQARAKGGTATLRNSVCLCYVCNKQQGTDSWQVYMRKKGKKMKSVTAPKRTGKSKRKASKRSSNPFPNFKWGI